MFCNTDQEWIPFEFEKEKASWLVFSEGGVTKNESLSKFEEGMVRLVVEPRKEEEGIEEGDETLGVSTSLLVSRYIVVVCGACSMRKLGLTLWVFDSRDVDYE